MPRKFFEKFLEERLSPEGNLETLHLSHGAKAVALRDILESGELRLPPVVCPTLGIRTIFAFYGRTSYRPSPGEGGLKTTTGAPVYLILKPSVLEKATRAYPLDTGAFDSGFYSAQVDSTLNAVDFGFPANEESLKRLISYFFGGNREYVLNQPKRDLNVPPGDDEAVAYYRVMIDSGSTGDERDSSIEINIGSNIEITADNVRAIVIPDQLEEHRDYGEKVKFLGIDIIPYRFRAGFKSDEYVAAISDAVLAYYFEHELI